MIEVFDKYLEKQAIFPPLISEKASNKLRHIITIPAFNEPDILETIQSIEHCVVPIFHVEIIVLINHSSSTEQKTIDQNGKTYQLLKQYAKNIKPEHIKLYPILIEDLNPKYAGAGLARKIAMDEAIRRFSSINQVHVSIISLDADTLVSENYLVEIEKALQNHKKVNCAVFNFKHRLNEEKFGSKNTEAIVKYELYLNYYRDALKYAGFPYAFFTVGSCFAVNAETYVKQGGMNRKKAGEDFYFLQKVFPLDKTIELKHVTVYPSARPSERVPFGTGPAIKKIAEEGELLTYQFSAFELLKGFFSTIDTLYQISEANLKLYHSKLDDSIKKFIPYEALSTKIYEINSNCASMDSFQKKFFNWFSALKVIQYLNFVHEHFMERKNVEGEVLYLQSKTQSIN